MSSTPLRAALALALSAALAFLACGGVAPEVPADTADTAVAADTTVDDAGADALDAAPTDGDDGDDGLADDADGGPTDTAPAGDADANPAPADPYEAFFADDVVHEIELDVTPAEWRALSDHMRAYAATDSLMRSGRYFRATFRYRGPAGDVVLDDVGFRTRGNTTRTVPEDEDGTRHRAHWKLDFNRPFDEAPGTPAYEARKDRRFATLRALNLKWADDEDDPSKIRERFAYTLFREAGVPAPRVAAAHLVIKIGDEAVDYGLYTAIEDVDKGFLKARFGSDDDGDLYKCLWVNEGPATLQPITNPRAVGVKAWETNYRPAYDLQSNEDVSQHERLLALVDALATKSGDELADWLDAHFEVPLFLRGLALNVLIGMPDDYWAMGNNYYLYFAESGRAVFIPYDYDHGLGGGWCGTPAWSCDAIATADVHLWKNLNVAFGVSGARHPLVDKVLSIPRYREAYDAALSELIGPAGVFSRGAWEARYAAWEADYAPFLDNDLDEGETMRAPEETGAWIDAKIRAVTSQLGLD
ncbi:MAG: CotH kinase family protein [Deltaproteobacteria bacterium]|nr:CotH kinase family protein [Deltaproteobacteria bacterium]